MLLTSKEDDRWRVMLFTLLLGYLHSHYLFFIWIKLYIISILISFSTLIRWLNLIKLAHEQEQEISAGKIWSRSTENKIIKIQII